MAVATALHQRMKERRREIERSNLRPTTIDLIIRLYHSHVSQRSQLRRQSAELKALRFALGLKGDAMTTDQLEEVAQLLTEPARQWMIRLAERQAPARMEPGQYDMPGPIYTQLRALGMIRRIRDSRLGDLVEFTAAGREIASHLAGRSTELTNPGRRL